MAPVLEAAVDLSDDGKRQIRQAVSDARRARRLAKAALSQAAVAADISGTDVVGVRGRGTNALALARGLNPKAMGAVLATAAAYGIYKVVPLAQKSFSERRARTRSGLRDGVQPKPGTCRRRVKTRPPAPVEN